MPTPSIQPPPPRLALGPLLLSALLALLPTAAHAQLPFFSGGKPTAFRNARIVTMAGPVIEKGTLVIKGARIEAFGADVDAPADATTIDAAGLTITPGLIDVDGSLAMTEIEGPRAGGGGNPAPTNRAFDAFDRYAADEFREALRNGVTAIFISPPGSARGITGTAAIVRLVAGDGPTAGEVLKDDAALCIDLGSGDAALARLNTLDKIRHQFKAALDYRETLDAYKEDLEEYEKKIKERADKAAKADTQSKDARAPATGNKPDDKPAPPIDKAEKKDAPPKPGADQGPKKEDEIKKPAQPSPDHDSDIVLKAIDHQLPVRVTAQRSEDILNALDLAKEFSLNIVLVGGADAHLLTDRLADANVPVVLSQSIGPGAFRNDEFHRRLPGAAAALSHAGVKWAVGSGRGRLTTRFVLMNAQLAAQFSDKPLDPLALVTSDAAAFLNLSTKVGQLAPGGLADLILWTGDPLDSTSRVREAYCNGVLLYREAAPPKPGAGAGQ